eukprot:361308-Chlamydomonas_euryale.AAC.3
MVRQPATHTHAIPSMHVTTAPSFIMTDVVPLPSPEPPVMLLSFRIVMTCVSAAGMVVALSWDGSCLQLLWRCGGVTQ